MIGALRTWLLSIIAAGLVLSILYALLPKGRLRPIVRTAGGVVLMLVILRPLTELDLEGFAVSYDDYAREIRELTEQYRAADNSCKAIHPGKTIATFAYGSKRMYGYIDHNPSVAILPVDYVNNPYTIAQNDNVVSVNAALEIDLSGQVCAESIGNHMFSGSGGQLDYVRGALMSRGGLSFIAFPSTAKGGTISKIKPFLAPGAGVTTGRNEVDMIVTEYGIAKLRGRTFSQRAKALISIAHPNFRDELLFEARKMVLML